MVSKKNNYFLIFTLFYLYFTLAVFESSKGNFIPFFIEEFKINNAIISVILSLNTAGTIVGSFLAGQYCEKYGHKLVYILGSVLTTVAVFFAPFISNVFTLCIFYFVFGLGRSFIAIGVDSMVPVLSIGFESILMNITHFMYGFGSFTGQTIYGKLLSAGMPWRTICLYIGIFLAISVILSFIVKVPRVKVTSDDSNNKKDLYKNPLIYMFTIALTFALISEAILNTWFISYMRQSYNLSPANAANYASIFFLTFAIGRLVGGFIINKIGNTRGLIIFLSLASIFLFTGLVLRREGLLFISMSGLFISITFPTMMVSISSAFKCNSSFAIGLIVTISNALYVFIFYITGALNDLVGTYAAFYAAPISIVLCVAMLIIINKKELKNI